MSKKIMLLALAAISAAVLALPAIASAEDEPLHLNPTPAGLQTIDDVGANPRLSTAEDTIECETFHGNAEFAEGGTTGTMELTFSGNCKILRFGGGACTSSGQASGTITTTALPFHLVTLAANQPGVLVTPNNEVTSEHFASLTCLVFGFPVGVVVKGNGVIGKISSPKCGGVATEAVIDFNATAHGVQEYTTVAGTTTEYRLRKGTENAAQDATGKVTLKEAGVAVESELDCT